MQALNPDETRRSGLAQCCNQVRPCDFDGTLESEIWVLTNLVSHATIAHVCIPPDNQA
jgi:hypothetical protein